VLIAVYLASAKHQFTLSDVRYGASAWHRVPVYILAFAGTYCAYPQRLS